MPEAVSEFFAAKVGTLPAEVEDRLARWARDTCVAHAMVRDQEGAVTLYMHRRDPKTSRSMNSLLRTLTGRWQMPLGDLGPGWLRLSSMEEFRAAALPPERPPELRPLGDPARPACGRCRLSDDFDQRALILLQELRAAH